MITIIKLINISFPQVVFFFTLRVPEIYSQQNFSVQYSIINYSHHALDLLILYHFNFVPFDQCIPISPTSILLSASIYLTLISLHT